MDHLLDTVSFQKLLAAAAAGTGTSNSSEVDMSGFVSVLGSLQLGALTSTGGVTLKAQETDVSGSGYTDITGATITNTGDTATLKLMVLEVIKPMKRYVRFVVTRATANCVIDTLTGIKIASKKMPSTQDTTVDVSEQVVGS